MIKSVYIFIYTYHYISILPIFQRAKWDWPMALRDVIFSIFDTRCRRCRRRAPRYSILAVQLGDWPSDPQMLVP